MTAQTTNQGKRSTDLRVVKTREAISQAFDRLIETTDYANITVSAIAREARISRKTFYAHYDSVNTLLREHAQARIREAVLKIKAEGNPKTVEEWLIQYTKSAMHKLHDIPNLKNNMIQGVSLRTALDMAREPLQEACAEELSARGSMQTPEFDFALAIYLSGVCAAYEAWATSDKERSLDEVAEFVGRAYTNGLVNIFLPQGM